MYAGSAPPNSSPPATQADEGPRRLERSSRASRRVSSRIRLAGASAVAVALDVGLYLSNIGDISSVSLFRGAASIENVFAPYKGRDRNSLFEAGLRDRLIKEGKIKIHQDAVQRIIANYRTTAG